MKDSVERLLATIFGLIFLGLSCLVAVEVVIRKVFNVSLQGVDELGGYSLAVGCTIAFSLALLGRNHIRVDVFHDRLPAWLQSFMNWLSAVMLAAFAVLIAWLAWQVLQDTIGYKSVSQTPWATPLQYPQGAWLAGLVMFALVTTYYALRATSLLLRGRVAEMNREFQPRSAKDELKEELDDLAQRSKGVQP